MNQKIATPQESGEVSGSAFQLDQGERSAFVVFADYCIDKVPEKAELAALVDAPSNLLTSIFHLSPRAGARLGAAIGQNTETWQSSLGQDLIGSEPAKATLVGELRYCRTCLAKGWHSALFQHPALVRCPAHGERLRCGCVHCSNPIVASPLAIAMNHFHCATCGKSLAVDSASRGERIFNNGTPSACFEKAREALTSSLAVRTASWLKIGRAPRSFVHSAAESKIVTFHRAWNRDALRGLRTFKEERYPLSSADIGQIGDEQTATIATLEAFCSIQFVLERYESLEELPAALSVARVGGLRLDRKVSLLSAAYWRAALAFGIHLGTGRNRSILRPVTAFGGWPHHIASMIKPVIWHQVIGLIALSILELRKLTYTLQVSWNQLPDSYRFCPAWSMDYAGDQSDEFRLRPVATMRSLERLFRRYAGRRLLALPKDVDVLQVLTEGVP